MLRHSTAVLVALAISATFSVANAADTKVDNAKAGAATGPIIRASTNTVINYAGGTPTNVVGSLDAADSTFNRPITCTALSSVGTAVAFDTITFNNTSAATATVNIRIGAAGSPAAACASAPDTFLIAYNGSFSPAAPLTNCVVLNDDVNGATDRCSALAAVSIPAGQTRVFVLTAFDNAATATGLFPYEVTFAGTTPVALQKFSVE